MGLFGKKKKDEFQNPDPLVNMMMGWADKMASGKFPYDKRVIDMVLELMEMDSKMCIQKSEFVLNFFMNNEIRGVNKEPLVKKLEDNLKLMNEKYEKIKDMKIICEKKEMYKIWKQKK